MTGRRDSGATPGPPSTHRSKRLHAAETQEGKGTARPGQNVPPSSLHKRQARHTLDQDTTTSSSSSSSGSRKAKKAKQYHAAVAEVTVHGTQSQPSQGHQAAAQHSPRALPRLIQSAMELLSPFRCLMGHCMFDAPGTCPLAHVHSSVTPALAESLATALAVARAATPGATVSVAGQPTPSHLHVQAQTGIYQETTLLAPVASAPSLPLSNLLQQLLQQQQPPPPPPPLQHQHHQQQHQQQHYHHHYHHHQQQQQQQQQFLLPFQQQGFQQHAQFHLQPTQSSLRPVALPGHHPSFHHLALHGQQPMPSSVAMVASHAGAAALSTPVDTMAATKVQQHFATTTSQHSVLRQPKDQKRQAKLIPCSVCGKGFRGQSKLTRHMRVHTREQPFECQVCGSRFTQRCSLKTHMKRHSPTSRPSTPTSTGDTTAAAAPARPSAART